MQIVDFVVLGRPQGKPAARFFAKADKVFSYAGAKQGEYKARIQAAWLAEGVKRPVSDNPFQVIIYAYFAPARSWTKARKAQRFYPHKPDADNLIKAVCDALTGLVWRDDAQVVSVTCSKRLCPSYASDIPEHLNVQLLELTLSEAQHTEEQLDKMVEMVRKP